MVDSKECTQYKITENVYVVIKPGYIVGKLVELNRKGFSVIFLDSRGQINRKIKNASYVFITMAGFIIDDIPAKFISVTKGVDGSLEKKVSLRFENLTDVREYKIELLIEGYTTQAHRK